MSGLDGLNRWIMAIEINWTITLSQILFVLWGLFGYLAWFASYQTNSSVRSAVKDVFIWRGLDGLVCQIVLGLVLFTIGAFWWIPVIQNEMRDG